MYRMPSHIPATHTYTFARSLRNGDADACVAGRPELAQMNRPEIAGEAAGQK